MNTEETPPCVEHVWEYSPVVLDVAPDGIEGRWCKVCGYAEQLGPVASEGWKEPPLVLRVYLRVTVVWGEPRVWLPRAR